MRFTTILALLGASAPALAASLQQPLLTDRPSSHPPPDRQDGTRHVGGAADVPDALQDMLDALSAMQRKYFIMEAGTWPLAIDWTAAVIGTHVSSSLSSLVSGVSSAGDGQARTSCADFLGWENIINTYFTQLTLFYFNENAFGLRGQAYDDMLWVVLGWLENVKFAELYTTSYWRVGADWHGLQISPLAAHRARVFYEISETGWDTELCNGGMVWNPRLEPYKNAITNELFTAASISMYLYWPGDNNTSPFGISSALPKQHVYSHYENAVKSYNWLMESDMTNYWTGLFMDGYHIHGWKQYTNGTIDPGTKQCDEISRMVYTYNQGVILTASRGLWIASGNASYLDDGHKLVQNVIGATGWPARDLWWKGLGRGGVMEEYCDHTLSCSQDGQTFKGIFFNHLADFCRPLWPQEEQLFLTLMTNTGFDPTTYEKHMQQCKTYGDWVEHNAEAVLKTKNEEGLFGMWWGIPTNWTAGDEALTEGPHELPEGAVDYKNPPLNKPVNFHAADINDEGRGRTVESQSSALSVLRARWQWQSVFG